MKTLITQVGSYLTGDATADAVVQYWLALTEERRTDVVDIPIVGSGGERSYVRLALGTTLPIAVVDAGLAPELDDDEGAARRLLARAHALTPKAGPAFEPGDEPESPDGYDSSLM
ncbi:hypothetical protein ACCO44_14570 [Microbacterium maritypicum]|uniref:hypothetical protein n=1 Tax=Microbacterium maritypicum TaxID=33918 RepID=UPI003555E238